MSDLVHRVAPSSARARMLLTVLAVGTAVLGVFFTAMAGSMPAVVISVLFTIAAAYLAFSLGSGLATQAAAAPEEANPAVSDRTDDRSEADPISTLQQRYAEGELTDEEFERRMERLMESEPRNGGNERRRERELNR